MNFILNGYGCREMVECMESQEIILGVVSDTHGIIRQEVLTALKGVQRIIHAGDIGSMDVLDALRSVAPVAAVRGNMDRAPLSSRLPWTDVVEAGGSIIYVLHDLFQLDLDPRDAGFSAVVSGHTHRGAIERKDGVLYVNPGSAGYGRGDHLVSIARLRVRGPRVDGELLDLACG